MLGSIIGDIVGSIYEFNNIRTKDFPFFTSEKNYTDDSVLTIATAEWLLHSGDVASYYARYAEGCPNPMGSYGSMFMKWIAEYVQTGKARPYNSCGNGSAMRVGPVGWAFNSESDVRAFARISAQCSHNHPEGIKGAQAVALCILWARKGKSRGWIAQQITREFGYDLQMPVSELQKVYSWQGVHGKGNGGTCQDSVPQAIRCALEAVDFEDAVRNAVSIGGDSDTIACITGSIAEALYGIPAWIREQALTYLPKHYKRVVEEFEVRYACGNSLVDRRAQEVREVPAPKVLTNRVTPDFVKTLRRDEIFVFGSNLAGHHGGGAALQAFLHFGAIYGQGVGRAGNTYAIPTMQGGVATIRPYVDDFIRYAKSHPELIFFVTRIGCGIAGFRDEEIAPLFKEARYLHNVALPREWWGVFTRVWG